MFANRFTANNLIVNRFADCPNHKDFRGFTSPVKKENMQRCKKMLEEVSQYRGAGKGDPGEVYKRSIR